MANLNWVDYIFLIIFFFSMVSGFSRGLVKEVVSLGTLIAAFIVATMFSNSLAAYFNNTSVVQTAVSQTSTAIGVSTAQPISYASIGVSFGVLFVGTMIVGSIIGFFLNLAFSIGILGIGNRVLGGVFGLAKAFIINLVIIFVVQLTAVGGNTWWKQSYIVNQYQPSVVWLGGMVSPALAKLKEKANETLQGVNSSLQNVIN